MGASEATGSEDAAERRSWVVINERSAARKACVTTAVIEGLGGGEVGNVENNHPQFYASNPLDDFASWMHVLGVLQESFRC